MLEVVPAEICWSIGLFASWFANLHEGLFLRSVEKVPLSIFA